MGIYGNLDMFEKVLEHNTHLQDRVHLEQGDVVFVLDIPTDNTQIKEKNLKSIW